LTTGKYRHTFLATHMRVMYDRIAEGREYRGEGEARPLIEWLNWAASKAIGSEPHRMGLERVLGAKDAILQLQDAEKMVREGTRKAKWKEFEDEASSINARLMQYEFSYALDLSKQKPISWRMRENEDPTSEFHLPKETTAIHQVIELAKQSLLNKVRKCDCGSYFFARLPAQRFHSKECRVRFWEASEGRKKRRREKAREYYSLHKSGKVATKKDYLHKSGKVR
jgi:hypothetical protein